MIWFIAYYLVGFLWFGIVIYRSGTLTIEDIAGFFVVPLIWPIAMPVHHVVKNAEKVLWRRKS